jgi:hypothetical protein
MRRAREIEDRKSARAREREREREREKRETERRNRQAGRKHTDRQRLLTEVVSQAAHEWASPASKEKTWRL